MFHLLVGVHSFTSSSLRSAFWAADYFRMPPVKRFGRRHRRTHPVKSTNKMRSLLRHIRVYRYTDARWPSHHIGHDNHLPSACLITQQIHLNTWPAWRVATNIASVIMIIHTALELIERHRSHGRLVRQTIILRPARSHPK